jgi:CheY-like chemotaxis protein
MARILLADDDQATRDLVRRALEADGHRVELTHDGTEALDKLGVAPEAIDVLVSDVHMPGIDGVELARRATKCAPKVRLLLMSGFAEELERAKMIEAPHLAVIMKPFTLEQMRAAVRNLLA